MKSTSLANIEHQFKRFDLFPPYQREGFAWSLDRKQYFMDSILNGYDIPKLYLRDVSGKNKDIVYSVIDGKQRLIAVKEFMEDKYPLGADLEISKETLAGC